MNSISVIIPAFNEQSVILRTINKLRNYFEEMNIDLELIVVNDGSSDNTMEILNELRGIVVIDNVTNRGKGFSVRSGVMAATKEWILFTDADGAIPIDNLASFLSLEQDADVMIGSKYLNPNIEYSLHRKIIGKTFAQIRKSLVGLPYVDTQCGFKLFKHDAAKSIFNAATIDGWCFDVEVLCLAMQYHYKIIEVPIYLDPSFHQSKVNILTSSTQMLKDLFYIRRKLKNHEYPAASMV